MEMTVPKEVQLAISLGVINQIEDTMENSSQMSTKQIERVVNNVVKATDWYKKNCNNSKLMTYAIDDISRIKPL